MRLAIALYRNLKGVGALRVCERITSPFAGGCLAPRVGGRIRPFRFARVALVCVAAASCSRQPPLQIGPPSRPLAYTNIEVPEVPWSIHVVRIQRSDPDLELHSMHADRKVLGLSTLTAQTGLIPAKIGAAVAAINGDFYERFKDYSGDPRGLQILDGELLTGPSGGASFWIDAQGECHATNVVSLFQVTWPGGTSTPFGLNQSRATNGVELFTPAIGGSTHTQGGRELVLERTGSGSWLPLEIDRTYSARVRDVHDGGDTPLAQGIAVLSVGPALLHSLPKVQIGQLLEFSTRVGAESAGSPNRN